METNAENKILTNQLEDLAANSLERKKRWRSIERGGGELGMGFSSSTWCDRKVIYQGKKYQRDAGRLEGQGTGHGRNLWVLFCVRRLSIRSRTYSHVPVKAWDRELWDLV